ncbi:MAG: Rieske 2Fe-2S domain-containing protein [Pseudomonadota bacterium]
MSVKYVPVQWNAFKWWYDAVLVLFIAIYILAFLRLGLPEADVTRGTDGATVRMRAFGSCAFFLLTLALCIGPLARLDRRFLPLLYNRRHLGVLTAAVAFTHVVYVFNWYYNFIPTDRYEALLTWVPSGGLLGFPIEPLGLFALICLGILAATSHDFWLSFLGAPIWKSLHLLIYPAYFAVVGHVALGYLQSATNPAFAIVFAACACAVAGLHVAAFRKGRAEARAGAGDWVEVPDADALEDGRARIVRLSASERAAVFRHEGQLYAVSNACAHQNGPLGEGRVIDGCITCPWHGFQYRLTDGQSPAPFTEKVPTYRLRRKGRRVEIDRRASPPGTAQTPLPVSDQPHAAEVPA